MRNALLACCLTVSFTASAEDALTSAQRSFKEAEAAVSAASDGPAKASTALNSCKKGALQLQFSGSVARLEKARKTLEKARREAQAYRSGLEAASRRARAMTLRCAVSNQRHRDDRHRRFEQPPRFQEVAHAWQAGRYSTSRTRDGVSPQ